MNRIRRTAAAAMVLALAPGLLHPSPARGQDGAPPDATIQVQETARERARRALPPEVFRELDRMGTELERDGVPAEILFSKALEGLAKRVPPDRIVPAVEAYSGRLIRARAAFGPMAGAAAPPALVVAGADALQRGVSTGALERIGRREDRSPMAVLVLAELVETGVPTEHALGLVGDALQLRTREREMLGLTDQVRRLMRQGRSAQDAADEIRRALRRGRGGGVGPPVPPGSEPLTEDRIRERRLRLGGG